MFSHENFIPQQLLASYMVQCSYLYPQLPLVAHMHDHVTILGRKTD